MSNLAIKGHPTRGSEVIVWLEMLGGINNRFKFDGLNENFIYYICPEYNNDIHSAIIPTNQIVYTLEEFLEKFPYKVGDKVTLDKFPCEIKGMSWEYDDIIYYVEGVDFSKGVYSKDLQPYKEETMEEVDKAMAPNLVREDYYGKRFGYKIPNGYEFDCIKNNEIILKPKYPISYEKCCTYLGLQHCCLTIDLPFNYSPLFISLAQLYICRNAYWKIAGGEMGLDKPWEPDLENEELYCIVNYNKQIIKSKTNTAFNKILIFPTAEMRDAFYENFKDLIECCKELL